jgi:hypothetical protein
MIPHQARPGRQVWPPPGPAAASSLSADSRHRSAGRALRGSGFDAPLPDARPARIDAIATPVVSPQRGGGRKRVGNGLKPRRFVLPLYSNRIRRMAHGAREARRRRGLRLGARGVSGAGRTGSSATIRAASSRQRAGAFRGSESGVPLQVFDQTPPPPPPPPRGVRANHVTRMHVTLFLQIRGSFSTGHVETELAQGDI